MILRPGQRTNAVAQRQLLDAARGGEAAGGFPELQLVAILQAASFQTANPRLEIRAARAKDPGTAIPPATAR